MTMNKKLVERRKHKRFLVSKGAFVALRPDYLKIGQVKDISMGGLAFTYLIDDGKPPDPSSQLDIFLASQDFYLNKVPFETISDFQTDAIPFSSVSMKECSVQFGELTAYQSGRLKYFIENHTIGEA